MIATAAVSSQPLTARDCYPGLQRAPRRLGPSRTFQKAPGHQKRGEGDVRTRGPGRLGEVESSRIRDSRSLNHMAAQPTLAQFQTCYANSVVLCRMIERLGCRVSMTHPTPASLCASLHIAFSSFSSCPSQVSSTLQVKAFAM